MVKTAPPPVRLSFDIGRGERGNAANPAKKSGGPIEFDRSPALRDRCHSRKD
jgi:hypothetical protein